MKNEIPRFTGDFAKSYDNNLGPFLFEPFAKDIVKRIELEKTKSVIEIACGTGRVTNHLRKLLLHPVKLTATDISEDMMLIAKNKLNDETIQFMIADALDLPFDENSFDLVICQFGVMFFPDKEKAFSEVRRVLNPGGTFLFSTWDKIENNPLMNTAYKIISDFFDNEPPVFYNYPFSMHNENEINDILKTQGFKKTEIKKVSIEGVSESVKLLTDGIIKGNPVYKEISDKDPLAPENIIKELEKEITSNFGDNPVRAEMNALIYSAEK